MKRVKRPHPLRGLAAVRATRSEARDLLLGAL